MPISFYKYSQGILRSKKSFTLSWAYCGNKYELTIHHIDSYISFALVCVLWAGVFYCAFYLRKTDKLPLSCEAAMRFLIVKEDKPAFGVSCRSPPLNLEFQKFQIGGKETCSITQIHIQSVWKKQTE